MKELVPYILSKCWLLSSTLSPAEESTPTEHRQVSKGCVPLGSCPPQLLKCSLLVYLVADNRNHSDCFKKKMDLLNDILFPHPNLPEIIGSWGRSRFKVQQIPGKMPQPHCKISLKMKPPLHLLRTQCKEPIISTACPAASSIRATSVSRTGPGALRPDALLLLGLAEGTPLTEPGSLCCWLPHF